jgi:hypothetical protein
MKTLAPIAALLALALTVVPPALFALGKLADAPMKGAMLAGVVLWFVAAPFWLKGGTD